MHLSAFSFIRICCALKYVSFLVDVGVLSLIELHNVLVLVRDMLEALALVDLDLIQHIVLLFLIGNLDSMNLLLDLHVHVSAWRAGCSRTSWRRAGGDLGLTEWATRRLGWRTRSSRVDLWREATSLTHPCLWNCCLDKETLFVYSHGRSLLNLNSGSVKVLAHFLIVISAAIISDG